MDPTGPIARRFPLVARSRRACTPLDARVGELRALADSAERDGNQVAASAVYNQAALLASELGLPDLARAWCHRHADAYLRALPLDAQAARHALEPLVNLARLHIRDGNGDKAFQLLDGLYEAVTLRTDIVIDGLPVPASTLTSSREDHQELRQWLWTVQLAEGARALTSAGRWNDALTHLQQHKGIGRRMLDGRQVMIIARATTGDADGALALLKETAPGEPWENAVTACLTVLCRRYADQPADQDLAAMLDRYQQLQPTPHLAVFDTRLGLSAIDAAGGVEQPGIRSIAADLIHRTMTSRDGYAAREVLAHNGCASLLTARQAHELAEVVDACALGNRAIPPGLRADLSTALDTSEVVLTRTLTGRPTTANLISAFAAPSLASLSAVTTDTTEASVLDPKQLRAELVAYIRNRGTFRTSQVEQAFLALERHLFLPDVDIKTAYAPQVVVTKRAEDGSAISSASHPNLVATQLEDLDVRTGHRVLEIGAATGINAGLIAELVGDGRVVTIEIDDDLTAGARAALAAAGYDQVEVICGDGAAGYPAGAPYDRIIVTAEAWDISSPWWTQLAVGGRIVVPLRLHGSGLTRSLAFDLDASGRMVSSFARVCGFVPMRGADAHDDRILQLTSDVVLKLDARDPRDEAALSQTLTHPAREHWTGLQVRDDEPVEHLDLWLATTASCFGRLSVTKAARESGLVDPALRWAGAALYDGGTIAYLALRQRGDDSEELGVTAHGPDSDKVAANLVDLLHRWDRDRPSQPIITAHPAGTSDEELSPGTLISRPNTRLTIGW